MSFREIFQQTDVSACIQAGISALGKYKSRIECENSTNLEGSVDIDKCLARQHPQENRWDYAFGYKNRIYYVEVHHVSDKEVDVVIKKYRWLKEWQKRQPNKDALSRKEDSSYHWISSGKITLTKNSQYARLLMKAGLDYPKKMLRIS